MAATITLRDFERNVWSVYFQDGLWDIFLGLLFLGGGLRTLTDNLWFYLLVVAGVLALVVGKLRITLPRVGQIEYGRKRKGRLKVVRIVVLAAVIFTALVLVMISVGAKTDGDALGWIFVFVVTGVFLLMASMMDLARLYGYTVLIAASMAVTEVLGDPAGARSAIVAGLVPLTVGGILLIRFLHEHPVIDQNMPMESGNDDDS